MANSNITYKTCTLCNSTKLLSDFYKNKSTKDGLHGRCKTCFKAENKVYQKPYCSTPEKREKARIRGKRRDMLKLRLSYYGLTKDSYLAMVEAQKGCCAVCGFQPQKGRLVVDHSHRTARVRGLLCTGCNSAIGKLGDTSQLLMRAVDYLTQSGD